MLSFLQENLKPKEGSQRSGGFSPPSLFLAQPKRRTVAAHDNPLFRGTSTEGAGNLCHQVSLFCSFSWRRSNCKSLISKAFRAWRWSCSPRIARPGDSLDRNRLARRHSHARRDYSCQRARFHEGQAALGLGPRLGFSRFCPAKPPQASFPPLFRLRTYYSLPSP